MLIPKVLVSPENPHGRAIRLPHFLSHEKEKIMSTAKKGMKKSTYLIIWTLVIALLCSAVGVVNYEALYWTPP